MCSLRKLLNNVIYQEMGDSGKGGSKAAEGSDRSPEDSVGGPHPTTVPETQRKPGQARWSEDLQGFH